MSIEVIDLFAGPGGLGEGFSSFMFNGLKPFDIKISIEKEKFAHQTLTLRSFYRQFDNAPDAYYKYLQGSLKLDELYEMYPQEFEAARNEAYCAELGSERFPHEEVVRRIKKQVSRPKDSIVIGGPPCQAYSLVGRSKMSKSDGFNNDPRHTLYKEYLKIIAEVQPVAFVMENVKGILSSKLDGEYIFDKILNDIKQPSLVLNPKKKRFKPNEQYTIYSLSKDSKPEGLKREDFVIRSEDYGIPQCRHRVILLAIRGDIKDAPSILQKAVKQTTVRDVLDDLPIIRSGLSKASDGFKAWRWAIKRKFKNSEVYENLTKGGNFLEGECSRPKAFSNWYYDERIGGVLNHESRSHIAPDLQRYYYSSLFAIENDRSPKLEDLPTSLLPNHKNVHSAIKSKSLFNDRFRVQLADKPATTITSHISKDGHYFIHYDPKQCRSLTVREAARIQTFPDNYKFEGPRTAQYQQVGNAVPPLLAYQIASVVYGLTSGSGTTDNK